MEQEGETPPDLQERASSGVRWIAYCHLAALVTAIAYTAVLARLLSPKEYGLFAIAMITFQIARYVEGLRLESALVQARSIDQRHFSSAFVALVVLGILFFAIFWIGAPLAGLLFDEPGVVPIIRVLAIIFLLSSFASVPRAMLNRELDFRSIGVIRVAQVLPSGAVGVAMALNGFGVWSLVGYSVAQHVVESALYIGRVRWKPSIRLKWEDLKDLMVFGRAATINEVLAYLQFNLPAAIIGRVAGPAALGIYQLANAVVARPAGFVYEVVRRVSFPVFSAEAVGRDDEHAGFFTALRAVLLVSTPAAAAIGIFADELVFVLYGRGWEGAVPLVRVLAPVVVLLPWMSLISSYIQSQGLPSVDARLRAIALAGILISLPFVLPRLSSVCAAIVVWSIVLTFIGQQWIIRTGLQRWSTIAKGWIPTLVATGVTAIVLLGIQHGLSPGPIWVRILAAAAAGAVVYPLSVAILDRSMFRLMLSLLVGSKTPRKYS